MKFNPHILLLKNRQQVLAEFAAIGCDPCGAKIMSDKAIFTTLKLESIPAKAANLLKQTFLAKGGEVAVARGTADLTIDVTDVLICATRKQYLAALAQLKLQPWGLPQVAAAIDCVLAAADGFPLREYKWSNCSLNIKPGRTIVMGIVNVTPDSFSDGGKYSTLDCALRHTEQLIAQGADMLDIGAESTRPYGSAAISAQIEMERLLPILEKVLAFSTIPVSVDTYKASVAEAALKLGAHMINDIWGLQYDPDMAKVVAAFQAPVIVMHNKDRAEYAGDIISHIIAFLHHSINIAEEAGIDKANIIVDPGVGFGKTGAHNLTVIARLAELKCLDCPILLGPSRKRFIGELLGGLPPDDRLEGTAAAIAMGIANSAHIVRVHDVKEMVRVARITDAILGGSADE